MADHEAAKIDKANHLLLDQPLLRLPYELLRKNFRSAHFTVEKESVAVKNALKESASAGLGGSRSGNGSGNTVEDSLKSLDAMIARMRGVKRKLSACADEEERLYHQVDARLAYLSELARMHSLEDVTYEPWSRRRLDRLLIDYLLRHGYEASATALVDDDEKGSAKGGETRQQQQQHRWPLRDLVDLDTFAHMSRIRTRLLRDHSVTEALAWCVDNKKELRKMESKLEFMLRYQQYIEMVRTQSPQKMVDAIAHARKFLFPFHATHPVECNQAAVLLCYPPGEHPGQQQPPREGSTNGTSNGTAKDRNSDLYFSDEVLGEVWGEHRWTMLADLFTKTHNQLLSLPSVPLLHLALSSGLSALKTPACHSGEGGGGGGIGEGAMPSNNDGSSLLPPINDVAPIPIAMPRSPIGWAAGASATSTTPGSGMASLARTSELLLNGHSDRRQVNSLRSLRSRTFGNISAAAASAAAAAAAGTPSHTNGTGNGAGMTGAATTSTAQIGTSVCPICSPELNELARYVPYAHHSKSHVEHDLVQLPNGRVYGRTRLDEYARKAGLAPNMVKDLRTGEVYPVDRLLKIYIT